MNRRIEDDLKVNVAEIKEIIADVKAEIKANVGHIKTELVDIKGEVYRVIGMLIGEVDVVEHVLKHLHETIQDLVKIVRRN